MSQEEVIEAGLKKYLAWAVESIKKDIASFAEKHPGCSAIEKLESWAGNLRAAAWLFHAQSSEDIDLLQVSVFILDMAFDIVRRSMSN